MLPTGYIFVTKIKGPYELWNVLTQDGHDHHFSFLHQNIVSAYRTAQGNLYSSYIKHFGFIFIAHAKETGKPDELPRPRFYIRRVGPPGNAGRKHDANLLAHVS